MKRLKVRNSPFGVNYNKIYMQEILGILQKGKERGGIKIKLKKTTVTTTTTKKRKRTLNNKKEKKRKKEKKKRRNNNCNKNI